MLTVWGGFWRADQRLPEETVESGELADAPSVAVVIPARNEKAVVAQAIRSHLTQTYEGSLRVVLVDDQSTDGTAEIAVQTAEQCGRTDRLTVLKGAPLSKGWTGKLWAMEQGFRALQQGERPAYVLFTDADIEHDQESVRRLVQKAECDRLDLVSLMVRLNCHSVWEKLLIPAFVFFFQMLYPFGWVNDVRRKTAAAAGGCALVRFDALEQIGGLGAIQNALIDDCALGAEIKKGGAVWLGLSTQVLSIRPYPTLESIWMMVARSAYTQLNYSPLLLVGTVVGMLVMYVSSPLAVWVGLAFDYAQAPQWVGVGLIVGGLLGWGLMAIAYYPTLRLYGRSPLLSFALPGIAFLYLLMTLDSARRHWQGKGGLWKGRVHQS